MNWSAGQDAEGQFAAGAHFILRSTRQHDRIQEMLAKEQTRFDFGHGPKDYSQKMQNHQQVLN